MFRNYSLICLPNFYRLYDKYGDNSNQVIRSNFNKINKEAMQFAFKNRTDVELNLILSKIYLYLGHHYMDQHYYDRAICLAEKCRNLCIEMEEATSHCFEVNYYYNSCNCFFYCIILYNIVFCY